MSAVLIAMYDGHATADAVRTELVRDGFPTDRVELTSAGELGQAQVIPRAGAAAKLTEYFRMVFRNSSRDADERWVHVYQQAVLAGRAVISVQPRGDVETERALELLNRGGPVEVTGVDLEHQAFERAAASEIPIVTWIGKVLAAPGAPDTTGLAKLP
jgi:hypothetical protein